MTQSGLAAQCGAKLLLVDLDMCILNTWTIDKHALNPVLRALHRSSRLRNEQKRAIEKALWTRSLQDVINDWKIPALVAQDMWEAYRALQVPPGIQSFGDEEHLRTLPQPKILVTSGFEHFQMSKVRQLGIESLFEDIIVDAIDIPIMRKGKKKIFAQLQQERGLKASNVMVIGDSGTSELQAGQELGMITVQTLRPSIERWPHADHYISSFVEL